MNLDDLGDHRPGQKVASDRGAVFPLVDGRLHQGRVREASRSLGLRTWDKPAAACLASRDSLRDSGYRANSPSRLRRGVRVSRALGFREIRVRHYGDTARIELGLDELESAVRLREDSSVQCEPPGTAMSPWISRGSGQGI